MQFNELIPQNLLSKDFLRAVFSACSRRYLSLSEFLTTLCATVA